jgi:hypothetical protein
MGFRLATAERVVAGGPVPEVAYVRNTEAATGSRRVCQIGDER